MYSKSELMSLTPTHLKCFVLVAELGTTLKAAEALGLSQSVVSQKLTQLERAVRLELFDRSRHRLTLTETGQRFLEHSKASLSEWSDFLDAISGSAEQGTKPLLIGFSEGQESSVIRAVMGELTRRMPDTPLEPVIENRSLIAEKLLSGVLDLVILVDTENLAANKSIYYRRLTSLPLSCLFHKDSKFARNPNLTCADFHHSTCYWPSSLKHTKNQKDQIRYFSRRGIDVVWKYRDADFCTVKRYLSADDCFTLTWNWTVDDPDLRMYRLADISCPVIVAWRRSDSKHLERVAEKVVAAAQKLRENVPACPRQP